MTTTYLHIRVDFLDGHEPLTQQYIIGQNTRLRVQMYSKTQKGGGSNRVFFTCMHADDNPDPTITEVSFTLCVDLTVYAPHQDLEARWTTWDGSMHVEAFPKVKKKKATCASLLHHRYQDHLAVTVSVC